MLQLKSFDMYRRAQVLRSLVFGGCILGLLCGFGCGRKKEHPGREYAPQMYHSVPYEPLTQITDKEAGRWLTSRKAGEAEFYNSNPLHPYGMNMRLPVAGTVPRSRHNQAVQLPYRIHKDSLRQAARQLKNPLDSTVAVIAAGKVLYARFCSHCHGDTGQGDGAVGKVYKGIPSYTSRAVRHATGGHIFHVITHGKGRMRSHASQVSPMDRWRIVRYVQILQEK